MKLSIFILSAFILTACAGNPPDWWNPSGIYGNEGEKMAAPDRRAEYPSFSSQTTAEEEEPAEQNIDPAFETYEEMRLTPLSPMQDEVEEEQDLQDLTTPPQQTAPAEQDDSSADDTLDDTLPPPSVLE